jgi:uncharacterized protein with PQ loop repeat
LTARLRPVNHRSMVTTAVGVLAVTCGLSRAWPQVARIVVRRDTQGVSALTWMLSLCAFISWEAIGMGSCSASSSSSSLTS